jgi:hypothetical protein
MDKNQISRGTHAGVLSTTNRRVLWARFFLLALFFALSLASLQPRASVQAADQVSRTREVSVTSYQSQPSARNCPVCQQALVECLGNGGGSECYAQYNVCIQNCF